MAHKDTKFFEGTLVLIVAGFFVKVLGAVYRIPLYGILGDEGIGLFQMAYPIYAVLLTVSSSGLNVAISKVVAERWAVGQVAGAKQVFRVSLAIMALFGVLGAALLYFSSGWIASNIANDFRAQKSIAVIAPALFFASVLSALRGWFQGIEDMTPSAVSQVLEQLARMVSMFVLAKVLMSKGLEVAAAGATVGAVVGAAVGMIYMWAVYFSKSLKKDAKRSDKDSSVIPSWRETGGKIARIAVPISLASGAFGLTQLLDLGLVPGRLHAGGMSRELATRLYGKLTGGAFPLLNITTVFTGALQVALVPSISAAMALKDTESARRRIKKAFTFAALLAFPAAVGIFVLADPIPVLLFKDPQVGPILKSVAPGVFFLAAQQVSSGVLQGLGLIKIPLKNLLWATFFKGLIIYLFVPIGSLGILAAGSATSIYFAIAGILNIVAIKKEMGDVLDTGALFKLFLSSAIMGFAAFLIYKGALGSFSGNVSTGLAIGGGAITYGLAVLLTRAVDIKELEEMPFIGRIFAVWRKAR